MAEASEDSSMVSERVNGVDHAENGCERSTPWYARGDDLPS
jgi:hypothetical protein